MATTPREKRLRRDDLLRSSADLSELGVMLELRAPEDLVLPELAHVLGELAAQARAEAATAPKKRAEQLRFRAEQWTAAAALLASWPRDKEDTAAKESSRDVPA